MSRTLSIAALLIAGLVCAIAPAQQTTIIESEGKASVAAQPDEALFGFEKGFSGPTLDEIAKQAAVFEKAVAKALNDLDITPLGQDPVQLEVPGLNSQVAMGRIPVRFALPAAKQTPGAGGPPVLAELAEKLRKAAVSLMADAAFEGFAVADPAPTEQDVVARASENALYPAEALGELIEGRVTGVEKIVVEEIRWEGLQPKDGALSIPPAVTCHARVRISYQYTPAR